MGENGNKNIDKEQEKENKVKDVCDKIFYKAGSDLTGNIGLKNLSSVMSMSDREFEDYLNDL